MKIDGDKFKSTQYYQVKYSYQINKSLLHRDLLVDFMTEMIVNV